VTDTDRTVDRGGDRSDRGRLVDRAPRTALAVFVGLVVVAVPFYLRVGAEQWFFQDEWDFLATRTLGDPSSLVRSHFEHWTTLPAIAYRLLWQVFGLHSYRPYQLLAIASHLGLAVLLRVVMRRAGVGPWLATIVAGVIVFFGSGRDNIIWGFQITFTWGVLLGVVHLLLADHDGPFDRRDWLGLLAGLLALMCSGTGVAMVPVVGVATLLRRGWRAACLHTVPLAAVFLVWWMRYSEPSFDSPDGLPPLDVWARFVARGVGDGVAALSANGIVALSLVVVLVVGFALRWVDWGLARLRRQAAVVAALLVGGVGFMVVTGYGRAGFYGAARGAESRYLYIVAVTALPAIAFAAEAIVQRWRYTTPVLVLLLVAGVPRNIAAADDRDVLLRGDPDFVLTLPTVEGAESAPPDLRPAGLLNSDLTIGWLVSAARTGALPDPPSSAVLASRARLVLSLVQTTDASPIRETCVEVREPLRRRLEAGESFGIGTSALQVTELRGGQPQATRTFDPFGGDRVDVVHDIDVVLAPASSARPPTVCG